MAPGPPAGQWFVEDRVGGEHHGKIVIDARHDAGQLRAHGVYNHEEAVVNVARTLYHNDRIKANCRGYLGDQDHQLYYDENMVRQRSGGPLPEGHFGLGSCGPALPGYGDGLSSNILHR